MDDYISRKSVTVGLDYIINELNKLITDDSPDDGYTDIKNQVEEIKRGVLNIPSTDVQPVVHGEWRDTGSGQECSVCGEIQYGYDSGRYYCANCGAKMDKRGGADNEVN